MLDFTFFPLPAVIVIFLAAAATIAVAGSRLAKVADALADHTGMGEILAGAVFVGISTSLPGAVTSVVAAAEGHASLAVGNALGGLTAQTAYLAIADVIYRPAGIVHAAASLSGLAQGVLLIVLIAIPLIAAALPPIVVFGIHPASVVTIVVYLIGLAVLQKVRTDPMWHPQQTSLTREEISKPDTASDGKRLWVQFSIMAGITAVAGFVIGHAGIALVRLTGFSETAVGTAFTAVATSLPELVTVIAATRMGAVNLAVGDVLGGNAFDILFLSAADVAHEGSIYAAFTNQDRTTSLIAILMTGVVLSGLLRRARADVGWLGAESLVVGALYAGALATLFL